MKPLHRWPPSVTGHFLLYSLSAAAYFLRIGRGSRPPRTNERQAMTTAATTTTTKTEVMSVEAK